MVEITNEDIDVIEPLLLPEWGTFNEDHRIVIKNLETVDIKACPGSGKTTSLIAKLLILEKKLPFENNRGICVLTHTNVGVNEIKSRSSYEEGNRLLQYPNHISTIQVFVNKYLAIPSYKHFYKEHIYSIDSDTYLENFKKEYYKIPRGFRQNIERKYSLEDLYSKLVYGYDDDVLYLGAKKLAEVYNENTPTYQYLERLKGTLLKKGVLSYGDAYVLAFKFIKEFPEIRQLLSARFKFLFIDEMQDTSTLQIKLLDHVFDGKMASIQRIGDTNQAIFDSSDEQLSWKPNKGVLSLVESKRFSTAIAKCINKTCVEPQGVKGNDNIPNIDPTIIVFNEHNIDKVLPTFAELIKENGLHMNNSNIFKAVGRVYKLHDKGKMTIPSYFPLFNKKSNSIRPSYRTLYEYIAAITQSDSQNVDECRQLIINTLLEVIKFENIKNGDRLYTEKTLLQTLAEKNNQLVINLNGWIAKWILEIKNGKEIQSEIAGFLTNKFIPFLKESKHITNELKDFCTKTVISDVSDETNAIEQTNTYIHPNTLNEEEVKVSLDTVHNVKGETHTATLYLETFYKKYDLSYIMDYLKQKHTAPKGKDKANALCIAYVGMTRPTHLLCLAMSEETLEGNEEELKKVGWNIMKVNK